MTAKLTISCDHPDCTSAVTSTGPTPHSLAVMRRFALEPKGWTTCRVKNPFWNESSPRWTPKSYMLDRCPLDAETRLVMVAVSLFTYRIEVKQPAKRKD